MGLDSVPPSVRLPRILTNEREKRISHHYEQGIGDGIQQLIYTIHSARQTYSQKRSNLGATPMAWIYSHHHHQNWQYQCNEYAGEPKKTGLGDGDDPEGIGHADVFGPIVVNPAAGLCPS